ncbi:hypothetical protein OUZ56_014291 [Daphnia magna]|uniref:Uncharacterized protein n=1 Tax=Daphnia magna TaxID=35525 RepID=A0ABR0AJD3_9CRUS|nr:hypothetical protein OUZ56_014291 [Daphnia magna]
MEEQSVICAEADKEIKVGHQKLGKIAYIFLYNETLPTSWKPCNRLYFMHNVIWLPAVQNRLSPSSKSLRLKWTGIPRWPIHFKDDQNR